jgi:hypothetical protein
MVVYAVTAALWSPASVACFAASKSRCISAEGAATFAGAGAAAGAGAFGPAAPGAFGAPVLLERARAIVALFMAQECFQRWLCYQIAGFTQTTSFRPVLAAKLMQQAQVLENTLRGMRSGQPDAAWSC